MLRRPRPCPQSCPRGVGGLGAPQEAIIGAFNQVGGEAYLVKIAKSDPKTFCMLLGKVMPTQLTGAGEGPIRVASEGTENARDRLFAKIEKMRRRNVGAIEQVTH